jgi:hypothetical protein
VNHSVVSASESSSRAVRKARDWNRSSLEEMRLRMAWSRESSEMIRSCSGRTSAPEARHISEAISRISAVACSSMPRMPSWSRSSRSSSIEPRKASRGVVGVVSEVLDRRGNRPRVRPCASGGFAGVDSCIWARIPGPARGFAKQCRPGTSGQHAHRTSFPTAGSERAERRTRSADTPRDLCRSLSANPILGRPDVPLQ